MGVSELTTGTTAHAFKPSWTLYSMALLCFHRFGFGDWEVRNAIRYQVFSVCFYYLLCSLRGTISPCQMRPSTAAGLRSRVYKILRGVEPPHSGDRHSVSQRHSDPLCQLLRTGLREILETACFHLFHFFLSHIVCASNMGFFRFFRNSCNFCVFFCVIDVIFPTNSAFFDIVH